jgi:hypothetical protein
MVVSNGSVLVYSDETGLHRGVKEELRLWAKYCLFFMMETVSKVNLKHCRGIVSPGEPLPNVFRPVSPFSNDEFHGDAFTAVLADELARNS